MVLEFSLANPDPWRIVEGGVLFAIENLLAEMFPSERIVPFASVLSR